MSDRQANDSAPVTGMAELPRSLPLSRDLWPDIEARLAPVTPAAAPVRRGWGLGAVAASVAVAFLVGMLLGRQGPMPEGSGVPFEQVATPGLGAAAPALAAVLAATEREYQAAWKEFDPVGLAPALFDPEAEDELALSWKAMTDAETALRAALEEHPDNAYLAAKLLELRTQQLDFMRELHMLDQNSRRTI